ncbi:hypothetical protein BCV70DRAFT_199395 [Testicularia cyperi]|uniref:MOSC domain-containing protein n=1 Tax=Testicularia cyperi TaxID=1882483 RepID=A0A317XRU3_9BASI|nr:hypothetical protein BCV70DRAFT_199395 [Testicularia cyperi]
MEAIAGATKSFFSSANDMLQSALSGSGSASSSPHTQSLTKDIVVKEILIHPIKSCRGTSVQEAQYDPAGLQYDRTWLIIDANTRKFYTARELPKMVLIHPKIDREARILHIQIPQSETGVAACTVDVALDPTDVDLQQCELVEEITIWGQTVNGYAVSSEADEKLSAYFGKPVRLVRKGPSPRPSGDTEPAGPKEWDEATVRYQDFYPCLVASAESLRHVQRTLTASVYPSLQNTASEAETQGVQAYKVPKSVNREYWTPEELSALPITRFRPNILVDSPDDAQVKLEAWEEDGWVSAELFDSSAASASAPPFGRDAEGKGRAGIYMLERCARCMVPNIDPDTGVRDNFLPYRVLQEYRQADRLAREKGKPCFGMLSVPREKHGCIKVGDLFRVTKTTDPSQRER